MPIRSLRLFLLLFLLLLLCSGVASSAEVQPAALKANIRDFVGEDYTYAIDFLFFDGLAAGELRLTETERPNVFRAELIGRTLGVAAWLTSERTQEYSSLMELCPDGSMRSLEHTSRILKRKDGEWKDRGKRYRFDYEKSEVIQEKSRDGVYRPGKVFDIAKNLEPVDILTAFYNLRMGVYGPLVIGTQLRIPTFSSKGMSEILIDVLAPETLDAQGSSPSSGLLLQAKVDPEVFNTGNGELFFLLNDLGIPERGIVEDIVGLGDISGYLDEKHM